jgi:ribose transport system permease protein
MSGDTAETPMRAPSAAGPRGRGTSIERVIDSGGALVAIYLAMLLFFASQSEDFLTSRNLVLVAASVATLGIVAATQTAVIVSGGFDLSVGSTAALSSVVTAKVLEAGGATAVAIPAALGLGAAVGLLNALVITRLRVNPLIATLGMLSIVRGIGLVWTDALTVPMPPDALGFLGRDKVSGVPVSVCYMLGTFLVVWAMLRYTALGRFIFAVGGSERSAYLAGIHVERVRTVVYVASGASAGLAGLVIASQLIAGSPQAANNLELSAVTAAVLGGASLSGGQGRVWMTLVGALIMGTLTNGLVLMDVSSFWQMVVLGTVLIVAVAFDQLRGQRERV